MTTVTIQYVKNPAYSAEDAPELPHMFARLNLRTVRGEKIVDQLPIFYRVLEKPYGPIRVLYSTKVLGLQLETGNLHRLEALIGDTLLAVMRFGLLPEFVFKVGESAWPIYHLNDQFLTRYPGGPVFSAANVPELRRWLADHFKGTGRINNRKDLHLLYVSPYDLQLYPPFCMLRTPDDYTDDIPIYALEKGEQESELIAPINRVSFSETTKNGLGMLVIQKRVGKYLARKKRLETSFDLSIRKVPAGIWKRLQENLNLAHSKLTYFRQVEDRFERSSLDIYEMDGVFFAGRVNRLGRFSIFASADIEGLQNRIAQELLFYRAVNNLDDVQIENPVPEIATTSILDQVLRESIFQR